MEQSLDWHLLAVGPHRRRAEPRARSQPPLPRRAGAARARLRGQGFRLDVADDRDKSVFALLRYGGGGAHPIAVVSNFTPVPGTATACPAACGALARNPQHRCGRLWRHREPATWAACDAPTPGHGRPIRDSFRRSTLPPLADADLAATETDDGPRPASRETAGGATFPTGPGPAAAARRHAMAYVLAGGRGSRLMELTDRRAKPAVYFGGKIAHHRLRALERPQLGHPAHRRGDPVQGAQPHPPPAARLELPPAGAQRELRHPAREPARLRDAVVRGTADAVYQNIDIIESYGPEYIVHPGGRPHLQDGLRADAAAARGRRAPT